MYVGIVLDVYIDDNANAASDYVDMVVDVEVDVVDFAVLVDVDAYGGCLC